MRVVLSVTARALLSKLLHTDWLNEHFSERKAWNIWCAILHINVRECLHLLLVISNYGDLMV